MEADYDEMNQLHYVVDAVYSFAHALDFVRREVCGEGHLGPCEHLTPSNINGVSYYQVNSAINNVNFTGKNLILIWKKTAWHVWFVVLHIDIPICIYSQDYA